MDLQQLSEKYQNHRILMTSGGLQKLQASLYVDILESAAAVCYNTLLRYCLLEDSALNRFEGVKPSGGKVALCSVFALVLGVLQPLAILFQLMLPMPGISLAMIAAVVMYGCAGMVPVIVLSVASALGSLFMFGIAAGVLSMAIWIVPAAVLIRGMQKKEQFFGQLSKGIAAALIVMVIAVAGLVLLYGSDMIALVIDQLRQTFDAQQEKFWEQLAPMFGSEMTFEHFVEWYFEMFNMLQVYYEYYLVANLLSGAIVSAAIAALWGNWKIARRGEATADSYRGLAQWYLPANTVWGLLMMLVVGFIANQTGLSVMNTAWIVVESICQTAFLIQFLAALERRMRKGGSGHTARIVLMVLILVLAYAWGRTGYLAILGCASALFGSKGAAKPLIDKFKNEDGGKGR